MFIIHDCVLMNVAHKNFSDTDSKPRTGCVQSGIFGIVLKDIFIVSFQHIILYGTLNFYFEDARGKLTVHLYILAL